MKVNSKIGMVVDGYWKVVSRRTAEDRRPFYTLENIYNHTKVEVEYRSLNKIMNGEQSVAWFVRKNIPTNEKCSFWHSWKTHL